MYHSSMPMRVLVVYQDIVTGTRKGKRQEPSCSIPTLLTSIRTCCRTESTMQSAALDETQETLGLTREVLWTSAHIMSDQRMVLALKESKLSDWDGDPGVEPPTPSLLDKHSPTSRGPGSPKRHQMIHLGTMSSTPDARHTLSIQEWG